MQNKPTSLFTKPVFYIFGLGAILLVSLGVYFYQQHLAKNQKADYQTAQVQRGTIKISVSATGVVAPYREIEIKAKSSGKIIQLPFDVSDHVKKGDLLVELDPIDEIPAVQQDQANLMAAEDKLTQALYTLHAAQQTLKTDKAHDLADIRSAKAKSKYAAINQKRLDQLLQKEYISQDEYDSAATNTVSSSSDLRNAQVKLHELQAEQTTLGAKREDVTISHDQVVAAKSALDEAEQHLRDTKIYAPIDGVVSNLNVQIGQILASGITNVGGGTPALSVADISRLYVLASVDESDIAHVKVGQSVNITADSYPKKKFSGRVVRIATEGVNASNVVTFQVKIEVTSPNKSLLKPQMTANVEIVEAQDSNSLIVPKDALIKGDPPKIQILKPDQTTAFVPVKIGIRNDTDQEVLSGVTEGETVILHPHQLESRWRKDTPHVGGMRGPAGFMMGGGHHH